MKLRAFISRNMKEIIRDPLTVAFGLGFPLVLLFLLSAIQSKIPVSLFEIENITPGIAVFGLSFISLFSGMLIAKDRTSSFLTRLFASPMSAFDYIVGYTIPLFPIAIAQAVICFVAAFFLGLSFSLNILLSLAVMIPISALYIGIGLLFGTIMNEKQVGGVCGALLTNLSAWMSGVWFDINLIGGGFKAVSNALPFIHAVDAAKAAVLGNYSEILPNLLWVMAYAVAIFVLAVYLFGRKMKNGG